MEGEAFGLLRLRMECLEQWLANNGSRMQKKTLLNVLS